MKFWFDTEFYEDGVTIELISIGVIAEDGRDYYAEVLGADVIGRKSEWLEQNVVPHLRDSRDQKSRAQIARELIEFMGEKPEIWAYYADYDWVVLCQLYGRMVDLPEGWPMFCRDVKQLAEHRGNPELPKQLSTEHDALADAYRAKQAWEYLCER